MRGLEKKSHPGTEEIGFYALKGKNQGDSRDVCNVRRVDTVKRHQTCAVFSPGENQDGIDVTRSSILAHGFPKECSLARQGIHGPSEYSMRG